MDDVAQSYASNRSFMGTVLVARGSQKLFSKGYGSADLEWNVPNSPNTKFRLGSVTKQFTAASILLLEERGKLSVNDPVKKYLPDAPSAWEHITIFNLLTHTSGIPNFTSFPDYEDRKALPTTAAQLVARFRNRPLDFEPGASWSYSNSGYVLLSYLLEKVTGEAYANFLRQNIFTPLGMKDSGYDSNAAVSAHRASGYAFDGRRLQNAEYVDMTVPQGAGGLYSTSEDLLKWEQGLFGGKVLKPESLAKMTTPFKNNYAFGLELQTSAGRKVIEHGGAIDGFNTALAYYPDDKLTVVVLENVTGAAPPMEIAAMLAEIAHGETVSVEKPHGEITLDAAALSRYAGTYSTENGGILRITLDEDRLLSKLDNQRAIAIFPESETRFFPKAPGAEIEFSKPDASGAPAEAMLRQGGRATSAKRVSQAELMQMANESAARAAVAARRYRDQKQQPGTEEALRRIIAEITAGAPAYDRMTAVLAQTTSRPLARYQEAIGKLGKLESVSFSGVLPDGSDDFVVKFSQGDTEWRISLAADGKIQTLGYHPL